MEMKGFGVLSLLVAAIAISSVTAGSSKSIFSTGEYQCMPGITIKFPNGADSNSLFTPDEAEKACTSSGYVVPDKGHKKCVSSFIDGIKLGNSRFGWFHTLIKNYNMRLGLSQWGILFHLKKNARMRAVCVDDGSAIPPPTTTPPTTTPAPITKPASTRKVFNVNKPFPHLHLGGYQVHTCAYVQPSLVAGDLVYRMPSATAIGDKVNSVTLGYPQYPVSTSALDVVLQFPSLKSLTNNQYVSYPIPKTLLSSRSSWYPWDGYMNAALVNYGNHMFNAIGVHLFLRSDPVFKPQGRVVLRVSNAPGLISAGVFTASVSKPAEELSSVRICNSSNAQITKYLQFDKIRANQYTLKANQGQLYKQLTSKVATVTLRVCIEDDSRGYYHDYSGMTHGRKVECEIRSSTNGRSSVQIDVSFQKV